MEGKKKQVSSPSSSFTADLFGTRESPPTSSTGIFDSIFPRRATASGMRSSGSEMVGSWQKQPSGNQVWNTRQGTSAMNGQGAGYGVHNKDRNSVFQEERVEPCHLSSSIYYGGQENYSQYPSDQTTGSNPIFKKDGGEGDPNGNNSQGASRGNWWQGSLYY